MIQQTSLWAYSQIQPEMGERQKLVFEALKELKVANNLMISQSLRIPINQVTPRVLELRKLHFVEQSHTGFCPITKRLTKFWRVR